MDKNYRKFAQWVEVERNYAEGTARVYARVLKDFGEFGWDREGEPLGEFSQKTVEQYVVEMVQERDYAKKTVGSYCGALRSFFGFLKKKGLRSDNPAENLDANRGTDKLPKTLSQKEIKKVIELPDVGTGMRALLEVLYSTGARVSEVADMRWSNWDRDRGIIRVIGKGGDEREVPVGGPAKLALRAFEANQENNGTDYIFVLDGKKLNPRKIRKRMKDLVKKTRLARKVKPHIFRHSCAKHMLENGANLKVVQEILGHKTIRTTQKYTRVDIKELHEVIEECHPREQVTARKRIKNPEDPAGFGELRKAGA